MSNNPENWSQFANYLGGVIGSFISLLNLIMLTYLSIRLVKNDDERNKWTLQELARPLGNIITIKNDNSLQIIVENCGLGPMIMTKMEICENNKVISNTFSQLILPCEDDVEFDFSFFSLSSENAIVAKDKTLTLIKIKGKKSEIDFKKFINKTRKRLDGLTLKIEYSDIYHRKIETLICAINFHNIESTNNYIPKSNVL